MNWTELDDAITEFNNEMPLTENSVLNLLIKLAWESQLIDVAFKLIKLAWESQLTVILFKLIIKLACESQLTEILFKLLIIIINLLRLNLQFYLLLEL